MSESESPNLPVAPSAPEFAPPAPHRGVDLSDLQAELDGERRDAALDELVAAEFSKTDAAGEDSNDDGQSDEPQPQRKSRAQRYKQQIARQAEEIGRLQASLDALTDDEVAEALDPVADDEVDDDRDNPDHGAGDDYAADRDLRSALHNGRGGQNGHGNGHQAPDLSRYGDPLAMPEAEFDRLLAHFHEEQRVADRTQRELDQQARLLERHAREERIREWRSRGATPLEKRQNEVSYDNAMKMARQLAVHPVIEEIIKDHPRLPQLQEYFVGRPNELHEINRAASESPTKAAALLGALAERVMRYSEPRVHTSAPPPSRAPRGGAAPRSAEQEVDAYIARTYGRK